MSTSQRTINQVRSILGRLDRSIDEARQKRLHGEAEPERTAADADTVIGRADDARATAGSTEDEPRGAPPPPAGPARATPRAPSPFGRAKPLRKTGSDDAPDPNWKTP